MGGKVESCKIKRYTEENEKKNDIKNDIKTTKLHIVVKVLYKMHVRNGGGEG